MIAILGIKPLEKGGSPATEHGQYFIHGLDPFVLSLVNRLWGGVGCK
jgi:hypothetical protein